MTAIALPAQATTFTGEQKEYLQGMLAGIAQRQLTPPTSQAQEPEPTEPTFHGIPLSDLCKQELWKQAEHGLDGWERLIRHAREGTMPGEEDSFRFRFFGLFNVSPAQESLMLRCRLPAGEITAAQLRGLASIAQQFGDGGSAITTRSNLQIRGIHPRHAITVLMRLHDLGLTARGSGVDNVRNITASPTAGIDPQELIDTRPLAHELQHYILNHRDLYDLPRKFNVAFDGGGLIDTVADTNDIGFIAVRYQGQVAFRVELAGITGHRQLASDAGIVVDPAETTAITAAMLRVFSEHGDRTDRKKARLKYLIDQWGIDKFITETEKLLSFALKRVPLGQCEPRAPAIKHAHLGIHPQSQAQLSYVGVVIPVGMMTAAQMQSLATISDSHGNGSLRLTPWQNLIIPDVQDAALATLQQQLQSAGLTSHASHASGGLVACTGSRGCKYAASDTKGDAIALGQWLDSQLELPQPVNIHLTGCPNSCAQHYVGDIGLQAVKVNGQDGYNIVIGGGTGTESGIARPVKTAVLATAAPQVVEAILRVWLDQRSPDESFASFARHLTETQLTTLPL
jgi:ferredoxin-nitrite reductase